MYNLPLPVLMCYAQALRSETSYCYCYCCSDICPVTDCVCCRAIKQGMVKVPKRGFILRRYKWHIHAGSWSLVNCLVGRPYKALYKVLMDGLGLDGDRCIRVIPRHPPFSMKEEALPACKETIVRNILWSLRDRVMQQI